MPIDYLLEHGEPATQYKLHVHVLGKSPTSAKAKELQSEIKTSERVQTLLSERDKKGEIPLGAYSKWRGAHWVLAALADLDYPAGDKTLIPLREQALGWLLGEGHSKYFQKRTVAGKVRMHPSQEGNAVYYLIKLGLADARVDELVERMLSWRWPDGGWNCDMNPETQISSFMETLLPLRALAHYRDYSGRNDLDRIIEEVAEIFLKRKLFRRLSDGKTMKSDFVLLHYPCYWHYDILFGLKVIGEAGLLRDPRCADALDLLESKRLPDGGFPAEKKYYSSAGSLVDWGGTSKKRMNQFVTADALSVLKQAGRL